MPTNNSPIETMETDQFADFEQVTAGTPSMEAIDDFSAFEQVEPSFAEKVTAFGKGFAGGIIESAPAAVGGIAGGVTAGPAGFVAGTAGGIYAGGEAREAASETGFTFEELRELPEELRPYGAAGETIGAGLTVLGGVTALAKTGYQTLGKTVVGRYVNDMLNFAKTSTGLFVSAETSATISSGIAGGAAEAYDPGDAVTRLGAEVAAGMFNPVRVVSSVFKNAQNRISTTLQRFTPAGRETAAGKMLVDLLQERGEDPVTIAKLLRAYDPNVTQNVAQITGSKTLGAVQANLAKYSGKFGEESKQQADEGIKVLVGMIDTLRRTGDPEALKEAALLKHDLLKTLMVTRVQEAEQAAYEAASAITKDSPAAKMELSKIAKNALSEALKQARAAERELWGQVPDQPANILNFTARVKAIKDELVLTSLPASVDKFIKRIDDAGEVSTGTLTKLRSELLNMAREADFKGDFNNSRIFGELAEATLDDLDNAFTGSDAYDSAREFSKILNDTFTRTFAGKATSETRFGARVPPELLLTKAMSTGKEAGAIQMKELEEATRFLTKHGVTEDPQIIDDMMSAQERMVRLAAAGSIDTKSGLIKPEKLKKFIAENEVLLDRFPGVKSQLESAVDSEVGRQGMEAVRKKTMRVFESESEFAKLLKGDPVNLAQKAILSSDPERELSDLVKVAKTGGEKGLLGLRTSVIDAAMKKSTPFASDKLDFEKMRKLLFEAPSTGRKSTMQVLVKEGIFKKDDVDMLNQVFDMAKKIQTAQKPGTAIDEMDDAMDVITDLITRAAGATIATKGAAVTGTEAAGRGLIIAGGGSRAARQMMEKIPNAKIRDVLIDAMSNPALMRKLLETTPTPEARMEKVRFLHAYMIQSGIYNVQDTLESEEEPVEISESLMSAM